MIITRTPYRISFFGGGTDYPAWYNEHGGAVLSTTIDKYCYLNCRYYPPFFNYNYRIVWSHTECVNNIEDILHPVIPAVLKWQKISEGLEIQHHGDLPARSGMGSSSAFIVGILQALSALRNLPNNKEQLLQDALFLEQNILRENVGSQDQTSAVYGGFNKILFSSNDFIEVKPIMASRARLEELNDNLMLFYTGTTRSSSSIAKSIVADITSKDVILNRFKEMVEEGEDILCSNEDINQFGELLNEAWLLKRNLSARISNSLCDEIYAAAMGSGAIGGKILGAGGGGFMLLFVPKSYQEKVLQRLNRLIYVPFNFDFNGSEIVHCEQEKNTLSAIANKWCGINKQQQMSF